MRGNDGSKKLQVLRKKVKLLMKLRGYRRSKEEERTDGMDVTVFNRKKEKSLIRILTKSKLISGNVGVNQVKNMERDLEQMNVEDAIMIARGFSYAAKRKARESGMELISERLIPSFNIFNHVLVPKHEILPKENAEELLKKYRLKPYRMPRIKASDPIAMLIGAKSGDILKITRKSPTAGSYVTYRYVI